MQGRRLPDGGYRSADELQRGDYWLTEDHRSVWVYLPRDAIEGVPALASLPVNRDGPQTRQGQPAWDLTVHEDGTVTIHPSIHDTSADGGYHGFLVGGEWSDG